jgi:Tol biopolymer transport system component
MMPLRTDVSVALRSVRAVLFATVLFAAVPALLVPLPAEAQVVTQVTRTLTSAPGPGALDDAGTEVFSGTSSDQFGQNPTHGFQVVRFDAASGAGTPITARPEGVAASVSVSDDGQWLAFASPADLVGQNYDRSSELFVMRRDGTGIVQLTNDSSPVAGSVGTVVIAGNGLKILFGANLDPFGTNPQNRAQLFSINRDGSGLRQLTTFASGGIGKFSISDDGTKIALGYDGDPLGSNADLGGEIFAMNGDGTNLRQLTATPAGYDSTAADLSGNGNRVAFNSNANLVANNTEFYTEIFAIDWAGTGLRQVTNTTALIPLFGDPASQAPSITDDGVTIVFFSNYNNIFTNFDGNFEVFKIRFDGVGGFQALTSSALSVGSLLPTVSGNGGRVAFYRLTGADAGNPDGSPELYTVTGTGGTPRQLSSTSPLLIGSPDLSPDGSRIVFTYTTDLLGDAELWRVQADGTDRVRVTAAALGSVSGPVIAADDRTIVYAADGNPLGANADGSTEIFRIDADGTGLAQLTSDATENSSRPALASDGSRVAFDSTGNPTGGNPDGSSEIFAMNADGTGLVQLTASPVPNPDSPPASRAARIDASGTWIAFESNADLDGGNPDGSYEVWRVRSDGAFLQRLTGDAALSARNPDISGDGRLVVYASAANPLGTNPEGNTELFLWDAGSASTVQLTRFATGSSGAARISEDGRFVYFLSDAPVFETDPDRPSDLYRVVRATGAIERVGGLRFGVVEGLGALGGFFGGGGGAVPSRDGERAAFTGFGDFTRGNADLLSEIWLIDRLVPAQIEVVPGQPTLVRWPVESGPVRYDVIRGDVSALGTGAGGTVALGTVLCLADDDPLDSTEGREDAGTPAAGRSFFYLQRGSVGVDGPAASYGRGSWGGERIAQGGDCLP